ncbi:MAG: fumarylacetoacetate hydrolase family protein [Alphaproteobacteria bacterium]|jgi:acylpyruvate hydrolase
MKLATISPRAGSAAAAGRVAVAAGGDEYLDLAAASHALAEVNLLPSTMRELLAGGPALLDEVRVCLEELAGLSVDAREQLHRDGVIRRADEVTLLAPVPEPSLILSVGLNYRRHLAEMEGTPVPKNPSAFLKAASSLTGTGQPIVLPAHCNDMVDYEAELSFVFGRDCHNVTADEAMDYVVGYTIANDVSARNWIGDVMRAQGTFPAAQAWERNIMGKNFPTFTPCGPVLVTADEIADPHDLDLSLTLNGETMQATKTDDLIFGLPEIIAYFSQWYRFRPGDLVTTGTPSGVGFGRDPRVFLKPGDIVEVTVSGIGTLSNPVVAG